MTRRRRFPVRTGAVALFALSALLLAGCTADPAPADEAAGQDAPPVIAPGRPGEPAGTLSPEEAREAGEAAAEPAAPDFVFMRMMVEHHEQALVMTELAGSRAGDDRVRRLARRVAAAQGPEIDVMNAWLTRHAGHPADPGEHGEHGGHEEARMPGMASEEELAELAAARGEAFDALFLDLMSRHHEGGVLMAADVLAGTGDVMVEQLANDILATQTVEIERMADLRRAVWSRTPRRGPAAVSGARGAGRGSPCRVRRR
ncbi:DUF305 domain-containing protein [Streptomyces marincola]|uniref:DUF305 domain-containing protein n=1 Tax=Streptomyces marincola TaxID=2878388 RepID=A0A1X9PY33_9ACTN|nr:DUF305 domain-containing protein [Streptomyces marincola]ARP51754.1 DUF305 domain-containing protein [Streptomyces marincola]